MSPQNRSLIVGLAAPGLLWLATSVALGQDSPAPRDPSPAPTFSALLLSSGKVVRGEIVEDVQAGVYRLRASGGPLSFPKTLVEKAGGSVEELYQFRASRLPTGDPDERIKLARWCLTENLPAQAKEQLLAVQQLCPEDAEVQRMLYNLAATGAASRVDPEVRRTSGEVPAPLDPRVVGKIRKNYGGAPPVIFDLPVAQAVKRAGEFTDFVQPVLQQSCARCHNERYSGDFQLVEIKTVRDRRNADIARANLDATLKLVNPDDPSRSQLLSSGLVPHGPSKNAIFTGPNDRNYQILATWTNRLRPVSTQASRPPLDAVDRASFRANEPAAGDGFGAERGVGPVGQQAAPGPLPGLDVLAQGRASAPAPPSRKVVNQYDEDADFSGGYPDSAFPVPPAVGGLPKAAPRPTRPPSERGKGAARPPQLQPQPEEAESSPDSVVIGVTGDPNQLLGMDKPLYPTSPGAKPASKATKPKIDNALLEKMMKSRNAQP